MLSLLAACSSGSAGHAPATPADHTAAPRNLFESSDRPYLVDPMTGYPLVADGSVTTEIEKAFSALFDRGDTRTARETASRLLTTEPGFHPAQVLAAQTDFAAGQVEAALERLRPVGAELPAYTAARLLEGRAAERLDDVLGAYRAYRAVAEIDPTAAAREATIRDRAFEVLYNRTLDGIERGRLDVAEASVADLTTWAPDDPLALAAVAELSAARGERREELAAVRRLAGLYPDDRGWQERRAGLEVVVGNPREGVQILRRLVAQFPEDVQLADRLEGAKFRWRLSLQPAEVQDRARQAELTRGDFAVLLYWLVPGVRYARAESGRIAVDILDHPDQEALARVINLGLMNVDESLHRFEPERPVRRSEVLRALLRSLELQPALPTCLAGGLSPRPSSQTLCDLGARCRLLDSAADCLPEAAASGPDALEMLRRSQRLMVGGQDGGSRTVGGQ
ncbi:MAG: hypothetical protein KDD11_02940 [Acidobacteria bacterium]|nr:hypothetical protein [Acidobacteriota bacterium]